MSTKKAISQASQLTRHEIPDDSIGSLSSDEHIKKGHVCCAKRLLGMKKTHDDLKSDSDEHQKHPEDSSINKTIQRARLDQLEREENRKNLVRETMVKVQELSEPRMPKASVPSSKLSQRPSSVKHERKISPETSLSDTHTVRSKGQQTESIESLPKSLKSKITFPSESLVTVREKRSLKKVEDSHDEDIISHHHVSSHHSRAPSAGKSLGQKSLHSRVTDHESQREDPETDFSDIQQVQSKHCSRHHKAAAQKSRVEDHHEVASHKSRAKSDKTLAGNDHESESVHHDVLSHKSCAPSGKTLGEKSLHSRIEEHESDCVHHEVISHKSKASSGRTLGGHDHESDSRHHDNLSHKSRATSGKSLERKSSHSRIAHHVSQREDPETDYSDIQQPSSRHSKTNVSQKSAGKSLHSKADHHEVASNKSLAMSGKTMAKNSSHSRAPDHESDSRHHDVISHKSKASSGRTLVRNDHDSDSDHHDMSSHKSRATSGKTLAKNSSHSRAPDHESDSRHHDALSHKSKASSGRTLGGNDHESDSRHHDTLSHKSRATSGKSLERKSSHSRIADHKSHRENPEDDFSNVQHHPSCQSKPSTGKSLAHSKLSKITFHNDEDALRKSRALSHRERIEDEAPWIGSDEKVHVCACQLKHPSRFRNVDMKKNSE